MDYVAGWCGKCKQIMPFVNQLSEDFGGVTFVKVWKKTRMREATSNRETERDNSF